MAALIVPAPAAQGQCPDGASRFAHTGYCHETPDPCLLPSDCDPGVNCDLNYFWNEPENWSDGVPDIGVDACIENGESAYTVNFNAAAKSLYIDSTSEMKVGVYSNGFALTLGDNSTIDGALHLYQNTTLYINKSLTIGGSGRVMGHASQSEIAMIKAVGGAAYTLTLGSGVQLDTEWDVYVPLVNNGAVKARKLSNNLGRIKLIEGGSGSGDWIAELGGTLIVDGTVTGSGDWKLVNSASSTIQIDAACIGLTGDVTISAGTLDVNRNFCTTGNLTFSGDAIDVASAYKAKFDVATCTEN
jgi:hypothetical protein